jgi:hypothetical protein
VATFPFRTALQTADGCKSPAGLGVNDIGHFDVFLQSDIRLLVHAEGYESMQGQTNALFL